MTPEILQERRIEAEVRRMHQLERCRSRARRRLAERHQAEYQEILEEERMTLTEAQYSGATPWTTLEVRYLRDHAYLGAAGLAELLGRSIVAIRQKAKTERVSLRQLPESRGHLLGQPRRASLKGTPLESLRSEVVNGAADVERIDRRKRERSICPRCGIRPQETQDGWCTACDVKELTRAYEAEKALKAAERENDATRQQQHRAGMREEV